MRLVAFFDSWGNNLVKHFETFCRHINSGTRISESVLIAGLCGSGFIFEPEAVASVESGAAVADERGLFGCGTDIVEFYKIRANPAAIVYPASAAHRCLTFGSAMT